MKAGARRLADSPAPEASAGLWRDFARSVRNNVMAEFGIQLIRLGAMVILARALTPEDFGIFKSLVVVSLVVTMLAQAGIPDALIQRRELRSDHESTAWWLSFFFAALTVAMLFPAAPIIAGLMAMPALRPTLRLLALAIFFETAAVTAEARLRRELRFGMLAIADLAAESAFLVIALALLWLGFPRWSLAGGLAARFGAHAVALWIGGGYLPRTLPRLAAAREIGRFAFSVWSGRLITVAAGNADFLLVGRLLGSGPLGFYAMAWDLLRFIPDRLHKVAGRVTLPAFCKLQDNDSELSRAYQDFFGHMATIVIPLVACVALAAPEVLGVVYGDQWLPAATPLRLLALGLALVGLRVGMGSVFYTKDYPSFDIYLNGARLLLIVVVIGALAGEGLSAVCAGMSVIEAAISVVGIWLACRLVGLRPRLLLSGARNGFRTAILCVLAAAIGKAAALHENLQDVWSLALVIAPTAGMFCWLESGNVKEMLSKAFKQEATAPVYAK